MPDRLQCEDVYGFRYLGSKRKVRDVHSQLQNGGGTAVIHVDGHLMALAAYNGNSGKYLILDSFAYKGSNRGTGSRSDGGGYRWLKESEFKGRLAVLEISLLSKK